jgi:Fe-S cluster assembly protein SufD
VSATQASTAQAEAKLRALTQPEDIPGWFHDFRVTARDAYFDQQLPGLKDEAWHFGDPRRFSLDGLDISRAEPGFNGTRYERICQLTNRPRRVACLSMVSGKVREISSSSPLRDAGVTVMALRQALALRGDQIQPYWTRPLLGLNQDKLIAGHFALVDNGFFVHIPRNITSPEPIHLIMESGEPGTVTAPHVLVLADPFCKAEIFVHYIGQNDEARNLQLGMIQLHLADGADIHLTKIQHLGGQTNARTTEVCDMGRDSRFASVAVHLGGRFVRHEVTCRMSKPGAESELLAMHFVQGRQRYDFLTHQDHQAPDTKSRLLFKGAVTDRGRASYQGLITVDEEAQHTDAYQASRNLILSPEARVDSSPQLDIRANDVRCSHGATTTNVGLSEIFYLQQRGLTAEAARRLLVSGFMAEVADRIPLETIRDYAYNYVLERLD